MNLDHQLAKELGKKAGKITDENYDHTVLTFRDRQAGIGLVYDPDADRYFYNVYCVETSLMKEIFTCEYEYLSDALDVLNAEFGTWESRAFEEKKGVRQLRSEVASQAFVFSATTSAIRVSAQPYFLEEQSSANERQYVWAYKIRIENNGTETVQLVARRWHITDSNGFSQEVEGPGVVGEQPILKPGEEFEYSSYTSLNTASGIMTGEYRMTSLDGQQFEVAIPAFFLG